MRESIKFTVYVFKPSGKYYTHEEVEIPTSVKPYNLRDYATSMYSKLYKGMHKVFICNEKDLETRYEQMYSVPFMID